MNTNTLYHIHLHSTVADLPLHSFYLPLDAPGQLAAEAFERQVELPGVIVMDRGNMAGMISRRAFHERVGRSFGVEVYLRRPLQTILRAVDSKPLRLRQDCSIPAAAQAALSRDMDNVYAPLVIIMQDGSLRLLDVYILLLAQSRLLDASNQYPLSPNQEVQILPDEKRERSWDDMPSTVLKDISTDESLLNIDSLRNLLDMMGTQSGRGLHALANQLVEDIPLLFNDARDAIYGSDAYALEKAAHTIRITANTFGLCKLVAYANEMEAVARKGMNTNEIKDGKVILENAMNCFPAERTALFNLIHSMQKTTI
jgi:hypothetical protein